MNKPSTRGEVGDCAQTNSKPRNEIESLQEKVQGLECEIENQKEEILSLYRQLYRRDHF